jgi:hypothetical protein
MVDHILALRSRLFYEYARLKGRRHKLNHKTRLLVAGKTYGISNAAECACVKRKLIV